MPIERLEITRYSPQGELLRRVSCVAGRVTVFRAAAQDLLIAYEDALCGRRTKERFEILVDGRPFRPPDHVYVGFGEQLPADPLLTVSSFLAARAPHAPHKVEDLLNRAGAPHLLNRTLCGLSAGEIQLVKLLSGMLDPERILISGEPFLPLDQSVGEQVASLLTSFAWREHGLVVVTQMSGRPETWIENPHIVRAQLERPRQATIGFGSEGTSELVERLRKGLLEPEPAPDPALAAPEARPAPMTRDPYAKLVARPKSASIAGAAGRLQGLREAAKRSVDAAQPYVTSVMTYVRLHRSAQIASGAAVIVLAVAVASRGPEAVPATPPQPVVRQAATAQPVEPPPPPVPPKGLDAYPDAVRNALLLSFSNPSKALAEHRVSFPKAASIERRPARPAELPPVPRAEPEEAPAPQPPPPFAVPPGVGTYPGAGRPPLSQEELEQRRQYVRQALLEAIQRRSQQLYGSPENQ